MIGERLNTATLQARLNFFDVPPGPGIDDADILRLCETTDGPHLFRDARHLHHLEIQVRAVKSADDLPGVVDTELSHDIPPDGRSSGRRQGEDPAGLCLAGELFETEIIGPEVVPPQ